MDSQTLLGGRLDQGPTKKPVVRVSAKEGLPVIAALNDVPRLARNDAAGETRHGACSRGNVAKSLAQISCLNLYYLYPLLLLILFY